MGLDAQIFAVGRFSRRLIPFLEYPADMYDGVPEGATIVNHITTCGSSDASYRLAEAFGVGALELHRHVLDGKSANLEILGSLWEPRWVEAFCQLRDAGFQFYYLPRA
jgi:hypothetical protein